MPERFIRRAQILRDLQITASTFWKWRKSGYFPDGVSLGPAGQGREMIAWRMADYEKWLAARPVRTVAMPSRISEYPRGYKRKPRKKKPITRPE